MLDYLVLLVAFVRAAVGGRAEIAVERYVELMGQQARAEARRRWMPRRATGA